MAVNSFQQYPSEPDYSNTHLIPQQLSNLSNKRNNNCNQQCSTSQKFKPFFNTPNMKTNIPITNTHHTLSRNIELQYENSDIEIDEDEDEIYNDDDSENSSFSSNSSINSNPLQSLKSPTRFTYHSYQDVSFKSSGSFSSSISSYSTSSSIQSSLYPTLTSTTTTTTCCTPINTTCFTNSTDNNKSVSSEKLSKLLHAHQTMKPSLYSNLSTSMKNLKSKFSKENLFGFISESPRLTDDKLPPSKNEEAHELEICKDKQPTPTPSKSPLKPFRNRENRINSEFLRLYAHDYNARVKSFTLPNSFNQDDLLKIVELNPSLRKFHYKHNIYRISNCSRDKLWNRVILPPRVDEHPKSAIDHSTFVKVEKSTFHAASIVGKSGDQLPGDIRRQTFKPAGVLPNGKSYYNNKAPNSGITKTQFTVKGWCNSRWLDFSSQHV